MIRYALKCDAGHQFDIWFRDNLSCGEQIDAGQVVCAVCGSTRVEKMLMAPGVALRGDQREAREARRPPETEPGEARLTGALRALRKYVESTADYVGPRFAEEARRIHHEETAPRSIYGETTLQEARSLAEEGVPCASLPWMRRSDS